jgi:hypothetical protein
MHTPRSPLPCSSIELLHLNCSNRVLAHLPYMIALDHSKKAVVLAIRWGECWARAALPS